MKKLLIAISIICLFALLLAGCDNTEDSSPSSTLSSKPNESLIDTLSNTDSRVQDSRVDDNIASKPDVQDSTPDATPNTTPNTMPNTTPNTTPDTTPDTMPDTTPDSTPESEPEIDKPSPEYPDGPVEIFAKGVSKCNFYYDKTDVRVSEFANNLSTYIKDIYGIEISLVGKEDDLMDDLKSGYRVLIGNIDGTERAKARLNSANDFGMMVSGRDYVLYATNSRLYEYMLEIMKTDVLTDIVDGSWTALPEKDFIYHESSYKDTSYVDYILKGNALTQDDLYKIFEARTYEAKDGTVLPYRIYIPYDYDRSKEYPVLIILHGAGERGNDNKKQLANMVLKMFKPQESPLWDSIVICPQCPSDEQWVDTPWANGNYMVSRVEESNELKAVLEILNMVKGTMPTDKSRYYVTGLSMGGFGTWDLIMRHTDMFAGAVPLCGGADFMQAKNLLNMPIWTIHGTNDSTVPISGTSQIAGAIQNMGGAKLIYEALAGYGHNVWDYAGDKAEIWTWLYNQDKDNE